MISPAQLHILQHSLGCDDHGQTTYRGRYEGDGCGRYYRNRFVTGPGGRDFDECRILVAAGLMHDHGPRSLCGGAHFFSVTASGMAAMREASPKPPRLTRAQQRYRDFLDEDSSMDFGEWLKVRRA